MRVSIFGKKSANLMQVGPWILLLSMAALLRIALALQPGLWVDEIFSLAMATGHSLEHPADQANPVLGDYVEPSDPQPPSTFRRYMQHDAEPAGPGRVVRAVLLSDTSPPLYYLLLNVWTRVLGTSDAALRLFSTFWAMACFPLLWLIGFDLAGRRAAWAASVLFAFSPLALHYSAEGRMYSLLWFLTLSLAWSTLALRLRGPRSYVLAVWILSAASGLLTHYFFVFVVSACSFWLILHGTKVSRLQLAGLLVVTALLVLPWYLQLPSNRGHWRVTKGWTDFPLSLEEKLLNPLSLAWSYLSTAGVWGGSRRSNILIAGVFALFTLLCIWRRVRFFSEPPRLLWLIAATAVLGPYVLDLLRNTNISLVKRYALPGLPAALLLVSFGLSNLSRRAYIALLVFVPILWLPAIRKVFTEASIYKDPFIQVGADVARVNPQDLIIVHSIPSGVLGVARYLETDRPIASWVVQLKLRKMPDDIQNFSSSYHRLALIKVHDLGYPSPAEVWLLKHKTLRHRDDFPESKAAVLYF